MRKSFALLLLLAAACAPADQPPAIVTSPVTSQATRAPDPAAELLVSGIGSTPLILIGELHGTRETPALVAEVVELLARQGQSVVLALEMPSIEQPLIDQYLVSDGSRDSRNALLSGRHWGAPHDGRDSEAMLALIEAIRCLRQQQLAASISLFDATPDADRDRGMADHIRGLTMQRNTRVVALMGNFHAMVRKPKTRPKGDDGTGFRTTAARELQDLKPWSVNVSASQVSAWACLGPTRCGVQELGQQSEVVERPILRHGHVLREEMPWDAVLTLNKLTPSRPALAAPDGANKSQ